ncbi:S8 family serine peptidase [Pseudoalteromonas sp. BDTF-M6]|uniref:S8 family serine peptidase n=1 Tax=Pseudoalteromonas sp. BDTF-M6 TaxID=2796132 RepID=UPI001BAF9890|nr:S8 family serine peptidase [Pseudoalteromonas sp. BDTF-M6]MBS3796815.1 S8 family serine peptidase [Pseudoalteromonas sp. BDTF-M6]
MLKIKRPLVVSAVLSALALAGTAQAANEDQRYIVKFKPGHKASVMTAVSNSRGKVERELDKHRLVAVTLSAQAAKQFKNRKDIEFVEVDQKRYLMAESTPYGISMVQADQVSDALTGNMKVCIMDTGYDLGHEDLPTTGVTGDDGYDNYNSGNWYEDGHGHGTHVSGTIAALGGNGTGVVGVNPSGNLSLHMVKVFNSSGNWAYGSDLIAAVDQCMAAGAKVISMSLGGGGSSSAEQAAFDNAHANGLLSIAAAGNDGNSSMSYPASYDSVMSVAAVDSNGTKASFSQYNSQVEIAAPGVAVNSTLPNNSYAAWSGTSMATPHVAGVAALVWSHYPSCSNDQVRTAMALSAEDRGSAGRDNSYGWGIVKAKAMFDLFADGCDVGELPPPPEPEDLVNSVPVENLAGASGDAFDYKMAVPSGASNLVFDMSGGSGDADLYVKFGSKPTASSYDCRPYSGGNDESCSFASPQTGTYYVTVLGYSSFSGVSLVGNYDGGGTPNTPPTSDFSYTCTDLSCDFDASLSADSDGSISSYSWSFGDGTSASGQVASHSYSADGSYNVTLTVTDNDGASDSSSQVVTVTGGASSDITLQASGYASRGTRYVDLTWSNANGSNVDVYRTKNRDTVTFSTANDGAHTDSFGGGGSFVYKVCESGTSICSPEVTVNF